MSTRFKVIFFIRTLGYSLFLSGLVGVVAFFAPLLQVEIQYRFDRAFGSKGPTQLKSSPNPPGVGFQDIQVGEQATVPVSADFGIVIERINANSKVVENVNPSNEEEYSEALKIGVAHARGTSFPGESGNMYLFSHSTDSPWNIIRYNAVFYLLRELEEKDKVVVFYKGRRFDYIVFDKRVVSASDTTFLTNRYDKPILTLQTCDPPGTLWKRLIVRARLVGT